MDKGKRGAPDPHGANCSTHICIKEKCPNHSKPAHDCQPVNRVDINVTVTHALSAFEIKGLQ